MSWILAAVAPALAGLAILGFLAFRVFLATRRLGREVERARLRLTPAHAALTERLRAIQTRRG